MRRSLASRRSRASFASWLHVGSLAVKLDEIRIANRSYLIDPEGRIAARYDKLHMFDVDLPGGESYREFAIFQPGREGGPRGSPVRSARA